MTKFKVNEENSGEQVYDCLVPIVNDKRKNSTQLNIAFHYRRLEMFLFFAEVFSIFAIILFARLFECFKRHGLSEEDELMLAKDNPIWEKVTDEKNDYLSAEPFLLK